ncbi:nitrite reductase small subunit NirD [Nocardioides sp. Y6]|uniref:Nitrite reductase small subunit NirD n=1 Tax=Nocardioides malaquae TaxID=2773426 RepID=A0ABR9RW64_9ACTN|nr:nitrite reductase small subunit NirD [Nocardioides malaquae]MBE7325412.1 nitrite reductase small subunit NirD [Nocardioides malaquae]
MSATSALGACAVDGRTATSADLSVTHTAACRFDQVPVEGGVTALVGGRAVAIFRTFDGDVHATCNYDPWSHASVMSRGIVGSRGDVPFVASPMHKQAFDLRNGQCLDDETVRLPVFDVHVVDGVVWVGEEVVPPAGGPE